MANRIDLANKAEVDALRLELRNALNGFSVLPYRISDGPPTDAPEDGHLPTVDTTNSRLYIRTNGVWRYSELGDADLGLTPEQLAALASVPNKADQSVVDAALALKADQDDVTTALATKVNSSTHTAGLALKADQTALDAEVQARQTGDADTLAAAATDASTKASAAEGAAISAAASDATDKVDAEAVARAAADALKVDKEGGYFAPVLVREIGDETVPADFPVGGLVFSKQPITVRSWDGLQVPQSTTISTTTRGIGDDAFALVSGTAMLYANDAITIPATTTTQYVSYDALDLGAFAARFYFRNEAATPSSNAVIFRAENETAQQIIVLLVNSSNQLVLRDSTNATVFTSSALTLNRTYRVEVRRAAGSSSIVLAIYDLAGNQTALTTQNMARDHLVYRLLWGRQNSVQYGPGHFSHIAVTDTNQEVGDYLGVRA
ncbi:UNVERIFIED_CONTAM: hypothetical protein RF653_10085 [Kocuria sp. CPCC 205316]|uniref:hypothetical protein n=1 Tax=Kocuria TaxID=57493 RepID=UPI0036DB69C8